MYKLQLRSSHFIHKSKFSETQPLHYDIANYNFAMVQQQTCRARYRTTKTTVLTFYLPLELFLIAVV